MNALLISHPAKLWAFNIGHPCPSLAKGELLLLSQAQPTIEGSPPPTSPFLPSLQKQRTLPNSRRVRCCVCFYGFASLRNSVHTRLMRPCIACPSRCYDHCRFYKHCRPHTVPKSIYAPQAQPQLFIIHYSLFIIHHSLSSAYLISCNGSLMIIELFKLIYRHIVACKLALLVDKISAVPRSDP